MRKSGSILVTSQKAMPDSHFSRPPHRKLLSNPAPLPIFCTVDYHKNLSVDQVASVIQALPNPQTILWYIGCNGLKKAAADFYKIFLIRPILEQNSEAQVWLVDLTAWNAFKNPSASISTVNSCCDVIETLSEYRLQCISSAAIFKRMQKISEGILLEYCKQMLQRPCIYQASQNFPDLGVSVRNIFSDSWPILTDLLDYDVAKAYSALQYLEGCLLVEEIFLRHDSDSKLQIVFALPNDELKYYQNSCPSFQQDVQFLLSQCSEHQNSKTSRVNIQFLSFEYGTELHHRPYNAPGTVLKKTNFSYGDLLG